MIITQMYYDPILKRDLTKGDVQSFAEGFEG